MSIFFKINRISAASGCCLVLLLTVAVLGACDSGGCTGDDTAEAILPFRLNYGVEFVEPSDFEVLQTEGRVDLVTVTADRDWQAIMEAVSASQLMVVIYLGWQENQICQGSEGWSWNGTNWELTVVGEQFLDFIAGYILAGGDGFLALYTVHEPFNLHSPNCTAAAQQRLYNLLKSEAAERGLAPDELLLFADIGTIAAPEFRDGLCDFCATWLYPNGECAGITWEDRMDSCLSTARLNYEALSAKSPDSILVIKIQSFGGIPGYAIPSAAEMISFGRLMMSELVYRYAKPYVFLWYVWEGIYPDVLKASPGGAASLQLLADVSDSVFE